MHRDKKTFFEILGEFFARKYYLFTSVSVFFGVLILYNEYPELDIKSEKDLYTVSGPLHGYSFKDRVYNKNNITPKISHEYYIWLDNYSNTFQIYPDDLDFFKERKFKKKLIIGQKIYLTIQKIYTPNLNRKKYYIQVLSIDDRMLNNYLDKKKSIENVNSNLGIYFSISLIFSGVIYYFIRKDIWTT